MTPFALVLAFSAVQATPPDPWQATGILPVMQVATICRMAAPDAETLWVIADPSGGGPQVIWRCSVVDGSWSSWSLPLPQTLMCDLVDLIPEDSPPGGAPALLFAFYVTDNPWLGPVSTYFYRMDPVSMTIVDLPECRIGGQPAVVLPHSNLASAAGVLYAMVMDPATYEPRWCALAPGAAAWTVCHDPPTAAIGGGLLTAALGGDVYALPLSRDHQITPPAPELWCFEAQRNAWRTSARPSDGLPAPPFPLHWRAAMAADGEGGLVLFPGYDASQAGPRRTFHRFRPDLAAWNALPDAPEDWTGGSCLAMPPGGPMLVFRSDPSETYPVLAYDQRDPGAPSAPVQRGVGGPALPAGGSLMIEDGDSEVSLEVASPVDDPNRDFVRLEVEVKGAGVPFSGTALIPGPWAAATGTATCQASLGIGRYHWRARAVDDTGRRSDWIAFGGDPDVVVRYRHPPMAFDPFQGVGAGERVPERTPIRVDLATSAVPGDSVILDVELRPVSGSFTGAPTASSAWVPAGSRVGLELAPPPGTYAWRFRLRDAVDDATPWSDFGPAGTEGDFTVVAAGSFGGGVGCGASAGGAWLTLALCPALFLRRR